jgi:uncharacterized coiled-coil protein SlyX
MFTSKAVKAALKSAQNRRTGFSAINKPNSDQKQHCNISKECTYTDEYESKELERNEDIKKTEKIVADKEPSKVKTINNTEDLNKRISQIEQKLEKLEKMPNSIAALNDRINTQNKQIARLTKVVNNLLLERKQSKQVFVEQHSKNKEPLKIATN